MSVPLIKTSFISGEVSPAMFGHVDLARMQSAASTMRNGWPSFHGGYYSRAGTALVGFSKQTGRQVPPRLLPFQFSINQGLALEFGNFYMRVILDGAFVSDVQSNLTSVSNSNPCVIGFSGTGAAAASAVPITAGVTQSYAPGEQVTLAGGAPTIATVLGVNNTKLVNLAVAGAGGTTANPYAPGDTITLSGGTATTPAVVTVTTTRVRGANVVSSGSGGTGTFTVNGTTGSGTKFQASVTRPGLPGPLILNAITAGGAYSVNPTNPAAEPVTGGGSSGIVLDIDMGVNAFTISNAGVFTANAPGGTFTQASSSGIGLGATFNAALFGPNALSVVTAGIYPSYPANPVAQASTTESGAGATFTVTTTPIAISPFSNGDWLDFSGVAGATQINGNTFVLRNVTSNSAQLFDVYGNPVNATLWGAYSGGGMAARIYTLATIYSENDLDWLKIEESADVVSICCVNQETLVEYPEQDLSRLSDTDWVFTPVVPSAVVAAPAAAAGAASTGGTANYAYVVTSVAPDGSESVASPIASVLNAVDVAATPGTITLTWTAVASVTQYNVYKAPVGYGASVPSGSQFGYAGSAFGTQLIDSNIAPDFNQAPPTHQDPFARGQIVAVNPLTSSGTVTSIVVTINTSTGSGAVIVPLIVNSALAGFLIQNHGEGYAATDTITLAVTGGGSATAQLVVGAQSGTYPGTVAYFQQRRGYAYTLNNPDTYFFSQPGSFTNFDTRSPPIDSDAITGSPWSVQVNGIQWMLQTAGGLLVFTGLQAWLLVGSGGFATNAAPISPTSQDANPQPAVGCSPTLKPVKINYDVIFADSNSQYYYDQPYQQYALSEPIDVAELSTHLFTGYSFLSHAWCRNPNKLLWTIRSDGIMLSFTYLKAEQVQGWARHDTQGLFQSNCQVIEPPVDALYLATQRFPPTYGTGQNTYFIERMDNRRWRSAEEVWSVDCGLALAQPAPNARLTASSASGAGACSGVTDLAGGQNYSAATFATVVDDDGKGPGSGAVPAVFVTDGVITAITIPDTGAGYTFPALVITEPAGSAGGSGASARVILDNFMTFAASDDVFGPGDVGAVIRMGGGIATVTGFTDARHVNANINVPISALIPGSVTPLVAPIGSWTLTAPVATLSGLRHLAGMTVTGLADGNVVPPAVVDAFGTVALETSASAVTIGLGFQAQLQGVYLEAGTPTVQGQRKKVSDVTVRIELSRGLKIGTNQPDGSTLSPPQIAPVWNQLTDVPDKGRAAYNALCQPLYTGDTRTPVSGGYATPGQVALQQDFPLPMQVLAFIPEVSTGDTPQDKWPKKEQKGQG